MKKVFLIIYTAVQHWAVAKEGGRVPENEVVEKFRDRHIAEQRYHDLTVNCSVIKFSDGREFREKRISDSLGVCNVSLDSTFVPADKLPKITK